MHIDPGQIAVERQTRSLVRRAFSGQRHIVRGKEKHMIHMALNIYRRWRIGPSHWQAKHVRWFLGSLSERSTGTQYRYFRYIRVCLITMDRWVDWEPHLRGPWQQP